MDSREARQRWLIRDPVFRVPPDRFMKVKIGVSDGPVTRWPVVPAGKLECPRDKSLAGGAHVRDGGSVVVFGVVAVAA
jgi:hypothetical protein